MPFAKDAQWCQRGSRLIDMIMLSKRVIAACVGVMLDAVVDPGAGAVCSRSAMNSLNARCLSAKEQRVVSRVVLLTLCLLKYRNVISILMW